MASDGNIGAFDAYRPYLQHMDIFNAANFRHHCSRRIILRNVCHAAASATLMLGSVLAMLSDAFYCISWHFDLRQVALPLAMLINSNQIAITYVTVWTKMHRVNGAIASLNEIIDKRKPASEFNFFSAESNFCVEFSIAPLRLHVERPIDAKLSTAGAAICDPNRVG